MGLLSWLKKKPADGGDQPAEAPPAEEAPAESAADLAESLSASDGALRVDAARALLDRLRNGDDEARKALAARIGDLFSDEEPAVRATALSALRLLHAPELLEAHQSAVLALLADPVAQVRTTAVWSAARLRGETARTQVRALLTCEEEPLRFAAACALSELGDSAAVPELTAALREDHRRQEALSALMSLGDAAALPSVAALFEEESLGEFDRTLAAAALRRMGDPRGAEHLCARIAEGSDDAPIAAEWAGRLGVSEAVTALEDTAEREGDPARGAALRALGRLQAPGAEDRLLAIVRSTDEAEDVRMDAAEGLAELGTAPALDALTALSREEGELASLCRELLAEVAANQRLQHPNEGGIPV
ncbi:MAG: HEAT repeat domain-containing protein [Myxococcales bacterium]